MCPLADMTGLDFGHIRLVNKFDHHCLDTGENQKVKSIHLAIKYDFR